jgi:hypothetical protein
MTDGGVSSKWRTPNNSFKPNLLRYSNNMADRACHVVASATQVGLIQALGLMRAFAITACAVLLVGCNPDRVHVDAKTADFLSMFNCPAASGTYVPVAIPNLIANSAAFDGKAVEISGYHISSFEHSAIYPIRQDPFSTNFSEGIWTLIGADRDVSSEDRVTLRGIYTTKIRGHLGQRPGSICVHSVLPSNEA